MRRLSLAEREAVERIPVEADAVQLPAQWKALIAFRCD